MLSNHDIIDINNNWKPNDFAIDYKIYVCQSAKANFTSQKITSNAHFYCADLDELKYNNNVITGNSEGHKSILK